MQVKPFQAVFSGHPADVIDDLREPDDLHMILHNDTPIGLFIVDRQYHIAHTFAPSNAVGIRTLIVDQKRQGSGHGSAACQQMRAYLKQHYALKTAVYLAPHSRNAGALKACLRSGFQDTGTQHVLDPSGPRTVLRMQL